MASVASKKPFGISEQIFLEDFFDYRLQWFLIPDLQVGCICPLVSFVKNSELFLGPTAWGASLVKLREITHHIFKKLPKEFWKMCGPYRE